MQRRLGRAARLQLLERERLVPGVHRGVEANRLARQRRQLHVVVGVAAGARMSAGAATDLNS